MVYLTGEVGTDITLQKIINLVEGGETELMLTTDGGNFFEGIAIRDYLKKTNQIQSIGCLGMVASAGTLIMQGVKDRWATPSSKFLIHGVQGGIYGNADEAQRLADELRTLSNEEAKNYSSLSGKSIEDIKNIMDEERILYADEALSLNLINRISNLENFMTKNDEQRKWFTMFANKLADVLGFKNLIVQSTDGTELDFGPDVQTLEQIVVGVPCSANGTFVLADGRSIVVEGNLVTSVTEPAEMVDPMVDELKKTNEELTNKLTEANARIEELTNKAVQFESLKSEFIEFKNQFSDHKPEAQNTPDGKSEVQVSRIKITRK